MAPASRALLLLGLAASAAGFATPCWLSIQQYAPRHPALVASETNVKKRTQPKFRRPPAASKSSLGAREAKVVKRANYHPNALKCAVCNSESYTEQSFIDHINGAPHAKKNGGSRTFAGLVPNKAGFIPEILDPELAAAVAAFDRGEEVPPVHGKTQQQQGGANEGVEIHFPEEDDDDENYNYENYDTWRPPSSWSPPLRSINTTPEAVAEAQSSLRKVEESIVAQQPPQAEEEDSSSTGEESKTRDARAGRRSIRPLPPPPEGLVEWGPMGETRQRLPVFQYREQLLDALRAEVCLIEGETGSGKTTQVAQYLLEDASLRDERINIICTQPRRISAIGVAERVAAERGETVGHGAVGYAVRGESRQNDATSLLFCTTGVLLKMLEENPKLEGVTHVLVDEVHERSVENDFLLLTLRRMLLNRRHSRAALEAAAAAAAAADAEAATEQPSPSSLSIALMSATMDGDVLQRYFGGSFTVPRVSFPGRTFPVKPLYLEDAIELTEHTVYPNEDWCVHSQAAKKRMDSAIAQAAATSYSANAPADADGDEPPPPEPPAFPTYGEYARRFADRSPEVLETLASLDPNCLNVKLVAELVSWYIGGGAKEHVEGEGAVLIFLSGTREIDDVISKVLSLPALRGDPKQAEWVLPLHGSLAPDEQKKVFAKPPPGITKVVVATNVAETSITIDDVNFVIDSARVKLLSYDNARRVASLDDVLISQAAAKQRRGRAGRVRPGLCVHLHTSDAALSQYTEPEVRRVPLEQLIMRIKSLRLPGLAGEICAELPEPPAPAAVTASVAELEGLGAIDAAEQLTPLGQLLATLPIDPRLGKLIVLGACFGAIDEALTIAAALASRSPFMSPFDRREQASWSRRDFAGGSQSDYLAVMRAYSEFDSYSRSDRYRFARDRFLGIKTLQGIGSLKRQLLETMSAANLAPAGLRAGYVEMLGRKTDGSDGVRVALERAAEERGMEPPREAPEVLLTALLCAALHPQLSYVHAPLSKKGKPADPSQIKLHIREPTGESREPTEAVIHPSSVNVVVRGDEWLSPYAAYHEACFTTKLYVRGCTPVPPLAPLIFSGSELQVRRKGAARRGGRATAADASSVVTLDNWLSMQMDSELAPLLLSLRTRVDELFEQLVRRASEAGRSGGRGGRAQKGASVDAHSDPAFLELKRSIIILLQDALVDPLPPPQKKKPPLAKSKKKGGGRSRASGAQRRRRRREY